MNGGLSKFRPIASASECAPNFTSFASPATPAKHDRNIRAVPFRMEAPDHVKIITASNVCRLYSVAVAAAADADVVISAAVVEFSNVVIIYCSVSQKIVQLNQSTPPPHAHILKTYLQLYPRISLQLQMATDERENIVRLKFKLN